MKGLKAPFPYTGGKSIVADEVWRRFGDTPNYVEPFFGSGAVLLGRPYPIRVETINDADCYVSNFWRCFSEIRKDPEHPAWAEVAEYADWPVIENDLHSRHLWLVNQKEFRESMKTDPDFYDSKVAGWWVWGKSCWIGSGWCSYPSNSRPNLRPHQGLEGINNVHKQLPSLGGDSGASGNGIHATAFNRKTGGIYDYMKILANRMRKVRVCCGDWSRIMGKSVTWKIGITGVFLDPPYPKNQNRFHAWVAFLLGKGPEPGPEKKSTNRADGLYTTDFKDVDRLVAEVFVWCLKNGDNPKLRIALCGYEGEHEGLQEVGWDVLAWKANGGYAGQRKRGKNKNSQRERIWFSPHCIDPLDEAFTKAKIAGVENIEELPVFGGWDDAK